MKTKTSKATNDFFIELGALPYACLITDYNLSVQGFNKQAKDFFSLSDENVKQGLMKLKKSSAEALKSFIITNEKKLKSGSFFKSKELFLKRSKESFELMLVGDKDKLFLFLEKPYNESLPDLLSPLFDNFNDFFMVFDEDLNIIFASPALFKRLSVNKQNVENIKIDDFFNLPEGSSFKNYLTTDKSIFHIPLKSTHGEIIPVKTHLSQGKWAHKNVFFCLSRYEESRTLIEAALEESEKRFRIFLENSGSATFMCKNEKILYANRAACELLEYSYEELLDKPASIIFPKSQNSKSNITKNSKQRYQYIVYTKNQKEKWLDATISLIPFGDEDFYLLSAFEISAQKAALKALEQNELRYRSLFESSSDAILIIEDQKVIDCNQQALLLFEYQEEELKKLNIKKLFSQHKNQAPEIKSHKNPQRILCRGLRKSNTCFEAELSVSSIQINQKEFLQIILRDITEKKQFEEALKQSELKYRLLAENSLDLIWTCDKNFNFTYLSPSVYPLLGYKAFELVGKNIKTVMDDKSFYTIKKTYENAKKEKLSFIPTYQIEQIKKDQTRIWTETNSSLLEENGKYAGMVGTSRNVSKRKIIENEIRHSKEIAERANRSKNLFLANMSHEVRTPLNSILGFTDLLFNKETDNEKRKKLSFINQAGKNLLEIINDLLDFSKIEENRLEIIKGPFKLQELLDHLSQMFFLPSKKKNLDFKIEVEDKIPSLVIGDQKRISQILINIINNAIKFTSKGFIHVFCRYYHSQIVFKIKDSGIGIAKEKQKQIFDPFRQVHDMLQSDQSGTGLGLAISKSLAQLMKGDIYLDSKENKGSTFTVSIPLPSIQAKEEQLPHKETNVLEQHPMIKKWLSFWEEDEIEDLDIKALILNTLQKIKEQLPEIKEKIQNEKFVELKKIIHSLNGLCANLHIKDFHQSFFAMEKALSKESIQKSVIQYYYYEISGLLSSIPLSLFMSSKHILSSSGSHSKKEKKNIKILVAEDNPINQALMSNILDSLPCSYDIAQNGEVALDILEKEEVHILCLDIHMPKIDGLSLLKIIDESTHIKRPFIIGLSANALKSDEEKYLKAGCDVYLGKPFNIDHFKEVVLSVQQNFA